MPTDHRERLARIRRFDQLVAYLRDELGWPIASDNFEEMTFDYTPEELGIDAKNAAKIQEIKRLRPLVPGQPWGIFFVKFEPKRLPVVALRRILGQVALKKRASANQSERQAWAADDLLFVSNYGEGQERRIAFAHFSKPRDGHDLPTLKVLGWDNLDTPLHLDAVARELSDHLTWPDDEDDSDAWRERWRAAFTLRHREVISTSKPLSERLAELASAIRDRIRTALAIETESGPLTKLMKAFQTALVHDLDEAGFADMYAQTIAYGLLSARITDPARRTADDLATHMRTNPFLKELMETFLKVGGRRGKAGGPGIDFDELGVSEVVELLDDANMEAVVRDFGDRNPQEDPVIHFYEHFLAAYDKKQKLSRGVFYTPRPVVSYIVRSVDELLRTEFGLADGLADTTPWGEMVKRHDDLKIPEGTSPTQAFVQILDPATGTGTFLVEVIDLIHGTMTQKWKSHGHDEQKIQALWNEYVPRHLLPRLHGYELLMAPYAIAHLKIGLKLYETGYRFESAARAQVYLTNALEPPGEGQLTLGFLPALAHEAEAVNEIKRKQRFTAVIGNPPYSNYGQLNRVPFILRLLDDYKRGLDERKINLDDDFIKFVRCSQHLVETARFGIVGLITNNVFIDGITHRRMRQSIIESLPFISILDLHGNASAKESAEDGSPDENVFDITQGVAISLMRRPPLRNLVRKKVSFADIRGVRARKYVSLLEQSVAYSPIDAKPPHFFLSRKDFSGASDYERFVPLPDVFANRSYGIQTKRDKLTIGFERSELAERIQYLLQHDDERVRQRFSLPADGRDWRVSWARDDVSRLTNVEGHFRAILYRPFDIRWTLYTERSKGFLAYPRWNTMKCMLGDNVALIAMRQVFQDAEVYSHVAATNLLIDERTFYSNRGGTYLFPLYWPSGGLVSDSRKHNLTAGFLARLASSIDHPVDATDAFRYVVATLSSLEYRRRYSEFLKIDYPRVAVARDRELFRRLAVLGQDLINVELVGPPKLNSIVLTYTGEKNSEVGRVGWSDSTVWLDAGKTNARKGHRATKPGTIGFKDMPEQVWDFHIGGYQVCYKWLKDRKGRTLSDEDVAHYQKVVVALNETIHIMAEIDEVIEAHGGWPDAFQTGSEAAAASEGTAKVIPFQPRTVEPAPADRYVTCVPLVALKAAASGFSDPQYIEDGDFEWVTVESRHRLRKGMFVAEVVGKSMEPAIRDGAWCLFRAPVEGTRQSKIVLVQLRDATDPETGHRFTVKRYMSKKAKEGDSWRHAKITLKPVNPDFEPIVLTGADEGEFQVIAELVEVLEPKAPYGGD